MRIECMSGSPLLRRCRPDMVDEEISSRLNMVVKFNLVVLVYMYSHMQQVYKDDSIILCTYKAVKLGQ